MEQHMDFVTSSWCFIWNRKIRMDKKREKIVFVILLCIYFASMSIWKIIPTLDINLLSSETEIYNGFSNEWCMHTSTNIVYLETEDWRIQSLADSMTDVPLDLDYGNTSHSILYTNNNQIYMLEKQTDNYQLSYYDKQFNKHDLSNLEEGFLSINHRIEQLYSSGNNVINRLDEMDKEPVAFVCINGNAYFLCAKGVWKYDMQLRKSKFIDEQGYFCNYLATDGTNVYFTREDRMLCKIDPDEKITEYPKVIAKDFVICDKGIYFSSMREKGELAFYSFDTSQVTKLEINSKAYDVIGNDLIYYYKNHIYRYKENGKVEALLEIPEDAASVHVIRDANLIGIVDRDLNYYGFTYVFSQST